MQCKICGAEVDIPISLELKNVYRFWSPDDGWLVGALCTGCKAFALRVKPSPQDFAFDKRDEFCSDEDGYIDVVYG